MDLQLRYLSSKNKGRKNKRGIKTWSEKYSYGGKRTFKGSENAQEMAVRPCDKDGLESQKSLVK